MKSYIENINYNLAEIKELLSLFLEKHVAIRPVNEPRSRFNVMPINGDHFFNELDNEGKRVQDALFKLSNRTFKLIAALLHGTAPTQVEAFDNNKLKILKVITQSSAVFQSELDEYNKPIDEIVNQLKVLFPESSSDVLLICDTNALYTNTNLEKWSFDKFKRFRILITTSVLADLDLHKTDHRNEAIRAKAKTLINMIKEYRRRGSILDGIEVVKDKISFQVTGLEPDFEYTLNWLSKENKDDRLIAEFLEIARQHADKSIILITADINLQTKCEICLIPFLEPPTLHEV